MKLTDATAIKVGTAAATKVYLGATQVWPATAPGGSTSATLTIPAGKVASTLTSFPVRVDLAHMPTAWWSDAASDGGNVRVKQAGSVIPFDLVNINTTSKTGELFFKAASLASASANTFTIDKSGSGLLSATDPNGRNAVWSDYAAVMLGQQPLVNRVNGNAPSSSLGTITAASTGLVTTDSTQRWQFAVAKLTTWTFAATGVPSSSNYSASKVLIQVNSATATGDADRELIGIQNDVGFDDFGMWNSTDGWLTIGFADPGLGGVRDRWHGTHNGTVDRKLYRNGSLALTDATVAQRPGGVGDAFQIVGRTGDAASGRWEGGVGYAYLRNGELSASWIAAEVASWEAPASFYAVS